MTVHPDLTAEQAYIDRAYECLEDARTTASRLKGMVEVGVGGTEQARFEREVIFDTVAHRLTQLHLGDAALCFGRIDRDPDEGGETFYIGRLAVSDDQQEPLVIDWRAPVAEPFYRATGRQAMGLAGPQLIGGASDMLTAGSSSDSGAASSAGGAEDGPENAPEARGPQDLAGGADGLDFSQAEPLTPGSFDRQVRGLRKAKSPAPLASASGEPDTNDATREGAAAGAYSALRACRGDAVWGPGERVPVVYDGSPGVLIYRPASDGSQIVDLYLCGDTSPTRSVALHPST